jgi:Zn-dependent M28 family amino/carboxypeptidase
MAERLSRLPTKPRRTIVFAAFTAEELGTHGSRHYVDHSPIPIGFAKAMVNLDMVGRMKENRVTVSGVNTAGEFHTLVTEAAKAVGVEFRPSDRVGGSDHTIFYRRNIPVLHFYTGSHEDYHRPTDDWEKLNIEGMMKVSDLVLAVIEKIASAQETPTFVRAPSTRTRSNPATTQPPASED